MKYKKKLAQIFILKAFKNIVQEGVLNYNLIPTEHLYIHTPLPQNQSKKVQNLSYMSFHSVYIYKTFPVSQRLNILRLYYFIVSFA